MASERIDYYGYRLLARFAEVLPLSAVRPLSMVCGVIGRTVWKSKTALIRSNLRRVTGREPRRNDVTATFASYIRYWLEAFRLPSAPDEQLRRRVKIDGLDRIHAAREPGKGVILALPHSGNWDIAGAWLVAHGVPLTVVVEKLDSPRLFKWFEDFRSSLGFTVIENDSSVAGKLIGALGRNEAIALLCDRDVDGSGMEMEFFGETTKVPRGPALLALRTGAPLLPVAAYEERKGFRVIVDEPVPTPRQGSLRDDVFAVTKVLTGRIEVLIRRKPEQWHLFQPNWPSDVR